MTKKIAFQMDHISTINKKADSTYMLICEAQRRGFEIYHYTPKDLFLENGEVKVRIETLEIFPEEVEFFTLTGQKIINMTELDMVFIRQDPPFDMHYITTTYLLEKVKDKVCFINDPTQVRNAPEKLLACDFSDYMPKTLVSEDQVIIENFIQQFESVILKPLYACGGAGIVKSEAPFNDLAAQIKSLREEFKTQIMIQEYRHEIKQGDLRVILACGKIIGQVLRVPDEGKVAANFHAGGTAKDAELTPRQREISESLGKFLNNRGLYFVGLDFIGDYLTEINVTSPTGIQEINSFKDKDITKDIWDQFILMAFKRH